MSHYGSVDFTQGRFSRGFWLAGACLLAMSACSSSTSTGAADASQAGDGGSVGTGGAMTGSGGAVAGTGGTPSGTGGMVSSTGGAKAGVGGSAGGTGGASGSTIPTHCTASLPAGAQPADVSKPTAVIGTGTAGTCTFDALNAAVKKGGIITFNCGAAPVTIPVTSTMNLPISTSTVIDGGNKVTLDGGGSVQILNFSDPDWMKNENRVTLQHLTVINGKTTPVVVIPTAPAPCSQGYNDGEGGALFMRNGNLTVIDCTFSHNQAAPRGPDTRVHVAHSRDRGSEVRVAAVRVPDVLQIGGEHSAALPQVLGDRLELGRRRRHLGAFARQDQQVVLRKLGLACPEPGRAGHAGEMFVEEVREGYAPVGVVGRAVVEGDRLVLACDPPFVGIDPQLRHQTDQVVAGAGRDRHARHVPFASIARQAREIGVGDLVRGARRHRRDGDLSAPFTDLDNQGQVGTVGNVAQREYAVRIGEGRDQRLPRWEDATSIANEPGRDRRKRGVRDIHDRVVKRQLSIRRVDCSGQRRVHTVGAIRLSALQVLAGRGPTVAGCPARAARDVELETERYARVAQPPFARAAGTGASAAAGTARTPTYHFGIGTRSGRECQQHEAKGAQVAHSRISPQRC